jgi:hypothetical protein
MDWRSHFVIARPKRDGTLVIVYQSNSFKDSRYWLNYIAELYDALLITSLNPKYSGNGDPNYSCHVISRLKTDYNEKSWKNKVFDDGVNAKLKFIPETNLEPFMELD